MSTITEERALNRESRIKALKNRMRGDGWRRVCIERARYVTESYRQTEGEPSIIRRAKALNHVLSNMTIGIDGNELIVGHMDGDRVEELGVRGCHLLVEYSCDWLEKEIDTWATRDGLKFLMREEDKETLRELIPYWQGKTLNDKVESLISDEWRARHEEQRRRPSQGQDDRPLHASDHAR